MEEYIQTGENISGEKIRKKRKIPECGKMVVTFMLVTLVLKFVAGFFLPDGTVAALCPVVSFAVVFCCVFKAEFKRLLKESFGKEKNARGKVMGGVAKCFFVFFAITLCLGIIVKLTDLTGIDIFPEIKVSVPVKGFDGVVYALYMCILAPVIQELVFRGAVMKSLGEKGGKTAVLVSAILFALFHGVYITWIYAFAMGMIIGFVSLKSNSLMTAIETNILISVLLYAFMAAVSSDIMFLYIPLAVVVGFFALLGLLLLAAEKLSAKRKQREKLNFTALQSGWIGIAALVMIAEDILFLIAIN